TRHAHHGCDAHTRADQDHAFGLCPVEDEGPVRGLDFHLVPYPPLVQQPTGPQAMRLAFDRDFDAIAPGGRRCDRVGALARDASWRNMKREELSGQVVERDVSAVWGPEAERFDVVRDAFHLGEVEFAEPSDFSGSRIVPVITCGHGSKQRRLGKYLDVLMAWTGGGKAFRKGKKQPRIAFQANFSSDQCRYQASLLREKTEPSFRVCRDMDVRLADEAIRDLEPSI